MRIEYLNVSFASPDDSITVDELIQHINVLDRYAEWVQLYTEIEAFNLEP